MAALAVLLAATFPAPAGAATGYDLHANIRVADVLSGHVIHVTPDDPVCIDLPDSIELKPGRDAVARFTVRVRTDGDCFWAQAKATFGVRVSRLEGNHSVPQASAAFRLYQTGPHVFSMTCTSAWRAKCDGDSGVSNIDSRVWATYS